MRKKMANSQDNRARFVHLFSTPLTAMRGAIDLLRNPRRTADDPVTRDLVETLERNYARLSSAVGAILRHSRVVGDAVECVVPLAELGIGGELAENRAPADDARSAALVRQTRARPNAGKAGGSVLLIGQIEGGWHTIAMALDNGGYRVLTAGDGAAGIDLARAQRPDLIVLDFDMERPAAPQVAQVLREDPDTKTIPMIYATGSRPSPLELPPHVELLARGASAEALIALAARSIAAARARAEQVPTLLIVDDDADIQRLVTLRLQQEGYRVVPAATGTEALMAAQKQLFDLIILDLVLPDIDGFSVLGALRARTATMMTPIILLTAKDSPSEKVRGLRLGADDYVTKPFSAAELQARVRAALRRHEREAGANPSTRLPGNIAIERALRQRIDQSAPFAVCYADIDNFKAYNDTYSFLKGDAVIQQTAHVLLDAVERHGNRDDFVGHIGGDDFVVITTPDRAEAFCAHAIASFDRLAPLFYDAETRRRGFIDALDRQGRPARYPFVSLSIGIVSTARHAIQHVAEVAQRSVEPKRRAKELPGSQYVFED
jgi:diguanylate cyclase (GGDEF)-like protein